LGVWGRVGTCGDEEDKEDEGVFHGI
jgi:hypothetical protein